MRHSINGNIIYISENHSTNDLVRHLLNGNQIGLLLQYNSGLPLNILSNQDLNGDATFSDQPLFISRNSIYLPWRKNMDMSYTRFVPIRASVRGEVIVELKNVFNTVQMAGVNTTVKTDLAGNPLTALSTNPLDYPNPSGFEQRKLQLGFKVRF